MTHPHEDQLLLLAYGELPEADARELETHLAACVGCRAQLERLERSRVAADWALAAERPRRVRWLPVALAAAAVIADAIAIRRMVYLSMSWDHRVIDGATAAQFLARLKRNLESWDFTPELAHYLPRT